MVLLLLDLSAAFDTVDHTILLNCPDTVFGIKGKALECFRSYLTGRTHFVQIENDSSNHHELSCGVPQGFVLEPVLHPLYTAPLADVIKRLNLNYHFYADDNQIYMTFKPLISKTAPNPKSIVEDCLKDINYWMDINKLKLRNGKTELLKGRGNRVALGHPAPSPHPFFLKTPKCGLFSSKRALFSHEMCLLIWYKYYESEIQDLNSQ